MDAVALRKYEKFLARFEPIRRDDLRPGAEEWIGEVLEWQAAWIITEEDGGPYVGDWACSISHFQLDALRSQDKALPPFAWIPERDLIRVGDWKVRLLKPLSLAVWYMLRGQARYDPETDEHVSLFGRRKPASRRKG